MKLNGFYGDFGGYYVSEILLPCLEEVEAAYVEHRDNPAFRSQIRTLLKRWAGRPTPLYHSEGLSQQIGCAVYLKREDLLHGGAHKTNNTVGQSVLAQWMKKRRLLAETGAGQHGVATAMAGALLGLETTIYMGAKDVARQAPNVDRMRMFGAEVKAVEVGDAGLKDAINEALRDWTERQDDTYYVFGTAAGPHPFPTMVADFQSVMGEEIREQVKSEGRALRAVVACVGGGSNAIGAFHPFIEDRSIQLWGAEPGGTDGKGHGAALSRGKPGSLHGAISYLIQDEEGQIGSTHSVSAGLDYPGVGPQHSHLHATGRAHYEPVTDAEALDAFRYLAKEEGILCALETAHGVALARRLKGRFRPEEALVINLSGRGDKDLHHASGALFALDEQRRMQGGEG